MAAQSKRKKKTNRKSSPEQLRRASRAPDRPSTRPEDEVLSPASVGEVFSELPPDDSEGPLSNSDGNRAEVAAVDRSASESSAEPCHDRQHEAHETKEQDPNLQLASEVPEDKGMRGRSPQDEPPKASDQASDSKRHSKSKDEEPDEDSIHDAFFLEGEQVEKAHMEAHKVVIKPESLLPEPMQPLRRVDPARLRKMQRVVAYVVAGAVVLTVLAVLQYARTRPVPGPAHARIPAPEPTLTIPAATSVVVPAPVQSTEPASVRPENSVDASKEASRALDRGQWKKAIEMAKLAQEKDPEDATMYLYEATAWQELGDRAQARAAAKQCVSNAKRGPIAECKIFARGK